MKKFISFLGELLLHKLSKLFAFAVLGTLIALVCMAAQWALRQLGWSATEAKTRVATAADAFGPWLMFGLMLLGGYVMIKEERKRKEQLKHSKPPPLLVSSVTSVPSAPPLPHQSSNPPASPVLLQPKDIFKVTEL